MQVELGALGRRVRELRTEAGLRLADLAEVTGYTTSHISQIERGLSLPSLTALATLAGALGVEMTTFFDGSASPEVIITRAGEEDELRLGDQISYKLHGTVASGCSFSALVQDVAANESTFRHYGERFILVLDGTLHVSIDDESHELDEGATMHYSAHQEHSISAPDNELATMLIVSSPAIF